MTPAAANGELNPLARGLMITNATVGLIRTADGKWALDARGLVSLVGLPGAQGSAPPARSTCA